MIRKILYVIYSCLLLAGAIALLSFMQKQYQATPCNEVKITISQPVSYALLSENDIRGTIEKNIGKLNGLPVGQLNLRVIDSIVRSIPYVADCSLRPAPDGTLEIHATQRIPVCRIMLDDDSWYIDSLGYVIPVKAGKSFLLPVASGNVHAIRYVKPNQQIYASSSALPGIETLRQVHVLANYLRIDSTAAALTDQIYVNQYGELEIINKLGRHEIILGTSDRLPQKFAKLKAFYRQVIPVRGWDAYSTVNLKYKNQLVCTKKHQL